jgi:hypothetical protein
MFSYQLSVIRYKKERLLERTVSAKPRAQTRMSVPPTQDAGLKNRQSKTSKNKKPTCWETGTWASKLVLEKELRSNAPWARGGPATTTAVADRGAEALARDEHN